MSTSTKSRDGARRGLLDLPARSELRVSHRKKRVLPPMPMRPDDGFPQMIFRVPPRRAREGGGLRNTLRTNIWCVVFIAAAAAAVSEGTSTGSEAATSSPGVKTKPSASDTASSRRELGHSVKEEETQSQPQPGIRVRSVPRVVSFRPLA